MLNYKKLFISLFMSVLSVCASAWNDSLRIETGISGSFCSNNKLNPLWLYSNQWGLYSQFAESEANALIDIDYQIHKTEHFSLTTGLTLLGKSDFEKSALQEGYISCEAYTFDFVAGMKAHSPFDLYDNITTGNYLMSSNARPIPKISVGYFDFKPVPFTQNYLLLKFALAHGFIINDENPYNDLYTKDVQLHEKYLIGKLNLPYIKPYFGIIHSALIGGTDPKGKEIPIDYWATFFARESKKLGDAGFKGEATHVAGGNQGLWQLGINIETKYADADIYFDRIISGKSSAHYFNTRNKDFILGTVINLKNTSFLKQISVEYIKTDYHCGKNAPDPIGLTKDGDVLAVFPGDIPEELEERKEWITENFNESDLNEWKNKSGKDAYLSEETAYDFLDYVWGGPFGGRRPYLNNYMYYQGWSNYGMSFGTPLFHSVPTMKTYAGDEYDNTHVYFSNTRICGLHLGASGSITKDIDFSAKFTATKNHGDYSDKYDGGVFGLEINDYFFYKKPKFQYYSLLSINFNPSENWKVNTTVAYDFGDLYSSFGARVGFAYIFKTGKKSRESQKNNKTDSDIK